MSPCASLTAIVFAASAVEGYFAFANGVAGSYAPTFNADAILAKPVTLFAKMLGHG